MITILKVLGVWLLSVMVHWINPLNNPNNPESPQNYYHRDNIRARQIIAEALEKDKKQLMLNWNVILPYLWPAITTLLCIMIDIFFAG